MIKTIKDITMIHLKKSFSINIDPIYCEIQKLIGNIIIDLKANMLIILNGSVI